jgi:hypothetical protein
MNSITKTLTLKMREIANFIVLEGESKEFYWFALILTLFVIIGDSKLLEKQ